MASPAQVKNQSDTANKLIEELGQQLAGGVPPTQPNEPAATPAAPVATPTPTEQSGLAEQLAASEQRYRTLQGMYNADVARLNARVKDLEALLAAAPTPSSAPAISTEKLITDKDVEEYGDSIEVMRRAAREEAANQFMPVINELRSKIEQLSGVLPEVRSLKQNQAQSAEQKFWSELTARVPNWKDINVDQNFQNWLLETDGLSGITRQTFLEDAQANLDVNRVVAFFTSWPGAKTATPPAQATNTAQTELERQISPGKPHTAAPAPAPNSKVYTRAEVAQFYKDVAMGKFKGQDAERSRIERDIFAARQENRIAS